MPNHVFSVGIRAQYKYDFEDKVDYIRELIMNQDFVTDVLDYPEDDEDSAKSGESDG